MLPKQITDEDLLAVIDKGLDALGSSAKQALWYYLQKDFNFQPQSVPKNINDFQQALQKFFGIGYSFLDTLFKKYLQEVTGEQFSKDKSFAECVITLYSNKIIT